jgi:type II secretory pathway pseudopilin PulG
MKTAMATARAHRSQSGFAMIEVIVSAMVLAIIALAVLSGIDGAQGSSAREKARAVAGSLAEADQERMRGLSVDGLIAVSAAAPVSTTIDGATYTTKSEAGWVNDDTGGTPSCGNSSNNAEYFHITSTVSSNIVGTRLPPVVIDSLVSPSVSYAQAHGTLGAKIVDRNGQGLPGVAVTGTGPTALSTKVTDQNGCVLWRSIGIGSYKVTINRSGYCDETGGTALEREQTVSPNTVSFVNFTYDLCASAQVSVRTHVPGTTFSKTSLLASKARDLTDISSNGSLKTWTPTTPITSQSAYTISNLFPYPASPYGFFTGECQYQSPAKLGLTNYFTTTNSGASITADATKPFQPVYVYQPPLNLRISKNGNGNTTFAAGSIDVYLTLVKPPAFNTDTCADDPFKYTVMDYPLTGWGTRPGTFTNYVSQDKLLFDPGLPFGTYSICLRDTVNNEGLKYPTDYDNRSADGRTSTLSIDMSSAAASVSCP